MARFGKRVNAFLKRRWQREVLKHRWRAWRWLATRSAQSLHGSLRAFLFSLKLPPQERVAQLRVYADRLKRMSPQH
ncbi:hypothetical protein HRbin17_01134 [bacterium HR17]|jgi:hypothetical protein|uniref:Uncharacterized protein n=1 Tax=Candidatus Fervidibacter japonicus TaxID=2035412 RepID=A0A2H5XBP9_9BACT|nr:hypothetical protein HRbin17_01134 [bacterium HR17]